MNKTQTKIIYKGIDDLIPYVNNSRTHSEEQVLQIASSIKEFGFTSPVLIDGENGIIAGHGRVQAARKLGIKQIPCIELAYLSENQRKAYIIADNQIAMNADWDFKLLEIELKELKASDFDIDLLGFDDDLLEGFFVKHDYVNVDTGVRANGDKFDEWDGMPSYTSDNSLPIYSLKVNFFSLEDIDKFAELVGQTVTKKTLSINYPYIEPNIVKDLGYVEDEE